jgi:hypothetical protein
MQEYKDDFEGFNEGKKWEFQNDKLEKDYLKFVKKQRKDDPTLREHQQEDKKRVNDLRKTLTMSAGKEKSKADKK